MKHYNQYIHNLSDVLIRFAENETGEDQELKTKLALALYEKQPEIMKGNEAMNRKHLQIGLALAVATPNILAAPIAIAKEVAKPAMPQDVAFVQAASKTKGAVTPAAARSALQAELRSLTPAQKKQIGEPRLAKLKAMSGNAIIAGGCTANITHGVGCGGTMQATNGFICCILKL